jgi:dipeptidyl aminopeptidase/acylaminoacyl peptidase
MRLWTHFDRQIRCATFLLAFSLTCQAQHALTPAQALNYRRAGDLHLAPDGSKLLYVVYSYQWDWVPHLWLMDIATGSAREMTPPKKFDRSPQWSPDGRMLAFISNRDGKTQVYTATADGSGAMAVTARKYGVTSFHWSPDGQALPIWRKTTRLPHQTSARRWRTGRAICPDCGSPNLPRERAVA